MVTVQVSGKNDLSSCSKVFYIPFFSRRIEEQKGNKEKYISLFNFKCNVAESLCRMGEVPANKKRGRPSEESVALTKKRNQNPSCHRPPEEIRFDHIDHIMEWSEIRSRCKLQGCKSLSFIMCKKYNVHLCFCKERNCFKTFHVPQS